MSNKDYNLVYAKFVAGMLRTSGKYGVWINKYKTMRSIKCYGVVDMDVLSKIMNALTLSGIRFRFYRPPPKTIKWHDGSTKQSYPNSTIFRLYFK